MERLTHCHTLQVVDKATGIEGGVDDSCHTSYAIEATLYTRVHTHTHARTHARTHTLLYHQTVTEWHDLQHLQQCCFGGSHLGALFDEIDIILWRREGGGGVITTAAEVGDCGRTDVEREGKRDRIGERRWKKGGEGMERRRRGQMEGEGGQGNGLGTVS